MYQSIDNMKKAVSLILMFSIVTFVFAQQHGEKGFEQRLFKARLAEVCLRLDLSDEVKEKFAPIYQQYCDALQSLRPKPMKNPSAMKPVAGHKQNGTGMPRPQGGIGMPSKKKADMSDAQKVKGIKDRMEAQHRVQEVRLSYLERFSAILNDNQLVKFYEVEEDIQRKLHERANMGRHPGKGKDKK